MATMAPTIQNETEAGSGEAVAATETTMPTRIASRQLSALTASRVGFTRSGLVVDEASMSIRRHCNDGWGQFDRGRVGISRTLPQPGWSPEPRRPSRWTASVWFRSLDQARF